MNSEQSHKLAVGSSVNKYVVNEIASAINPKICLLVCNLSSCQLDLGFKFSRPSMPGIGRINPSNSNGGAIHRVKMPKPLSAGSKAIDANPRVKRMMDAKKKR